MVCFFNTFCSIESLREIYVGEMTILYLLLYNNTKYLIKGQSFGRNLKGVKEISAHIIHHHFLNYDRTLRF